MGWKRIIIKFMFFIFNFKHVMCPVVIYLFLGGFQKHFCLLVLMENFNKPYKILFHFATQKLSIFQHVQDFASFMESTLLFNSTLICTQIALSLGLEWGFRGFLKNQQGTPSSLSPRNILSALMGLSLLGLQDFTSK